MWLVIRREQEIQTDRRGRSQGAIFRFTCQLQLDERETRLADTYSNPDYPITQIDYRGGDARESIVSLGRLLDGMTISTRFVGDALDVEASVLNGCTEFKAVLATLESYGGEERVEI